MGGLNGVIWALVIGAVASIWFGNMMIGVDRPGNPGEYSCGGGFRGFCAGGARSFETGPGVVRFGDINHGDGHRWIRGILGWEPCF